jgi:hypothetical protein
VTPSDSSSASQPEETVPRTPLQQTIDQRALPGVANQRAPSSPETPTTGQHVRLLPGLVLIPSAPARKPSRVGKSAQRRPARWRRTAARWVGVCLLALAIVVSLLQVAGLRPGQQAWLVFQTGPLGSLLLPPTPTPKPKPTPKPPPIPPGKGQVVSIIQSVFGSYANAAITVATCESGLNPLAENHTSIGGSHAAGLFQILYPSTWKTTSQAGNSPYDATANTKAAYQIFKRDGYNWHEWSCQP